MPVTVITILHVLSHLILSKYYYYPCFIDEQTKAQKD